MTAEVQRRLIVVVNAEQQYALWPAGRAIPDGWREAGFEGSREDCLGFVRDAWRDLRPLGVRRIHPSDRGGA